MASSSARYRGPRPRRPRSSSRRSCTPWRAGRARGAGGRGPRAAPGTRRPPRRSRPGPVAAATHDLLQPAGPWPLPPLTHVTSAPGGQREPVPVVRDLDDDPAAAPSPGSSRGSAPAPGARRSRRPGSARPARPGVVHPGRRVQPDDVARPRAARPGRGDPARVHHEVEGDLAGLRVVPAHGVGPQQAQVDARRSRACRRPRRAAPARSSLGAGTAPRRYSSPTPVDAKSARPGPPSTTRRIDGVSSSRRAGRRRGRPSTGTSEIDMCLG